MIQLNKYNNRNWVKLFKKKVNGTINQQCFVKNYN
jgi:hypothetical protein